MNLRLTAAVSPEKIYGFQILEGGITAKDFGCFLINLLNSNQEIKEDLDSTIFLLDNANVHKAKILKEISQRLNLVFNAP